MDGSIQWKETESKVYEDESLYEQGSRGVRQSYSLTPLFYPLLKKI
jgi:hypothetical protein